MNTVGSGSFFMRKAIVKSITLLLIACVSACAPPPLQKKDDKIAAALADPQTSFFEACRRGDIAMVMRLAEEKRIDVNQADDYAWTGLMYAVQNGHTGLAEYFLLQKSQINRQDGDGLTPLMIAANERHSDMVDLLLAFGADPLLQDRHGYTALMWAIYNKSWDCIPPCWQRERGSMCKTASGKRRCTWRSTTIAPTLPES